MLAKKLAFGAFVSLAALSVGLGGCAGQIDEEDDDHEISDVETTSGELSSPDPAGGDTDDQTRDGHQKGERGDKDCDDRDGDHRKHHNHRHHKFKVLDRLDGTKDNSITIASLPAGLPDRLLAKLNKIDKDDDGIVTKAEAKAWMHRKKKHGAKGR